MTCKFITVDLRYFLSEAKSQKCNREDDGSSNQAVLHECKKEVSVVSKLFSSKFRMLDLGWRLLLTIGLLGTATLGFSQTERGWTGEIGGGFTPVVGALSHRLDNGWNFRVGGGYNLTSHFSTSVEYR